MFTDDLLFLALEPPMLLRWHPACHAEASLSQLWGLSANDTVQTRDKGCLHIILHAGR